MEIYHPRDEELLREMRRVRRAAKRKRLIWGLVIWLVLSIAAGIFLFNRFYLLAVVRGPAMGDTLPSGSLVLVRRVENDTTYTAGDILLYEKVLAETADIPVKDSRGKIRDYCKYIIYRDLGSTRQYLIHEDGKVKWITEKSIAEQFESDPDGSLHLDTEGMPNGEYWLIPFNINNPVQTQVKRVLAAPGDRIVLSPYTAMRINGQALNRTFTSGRAEDVEVDTRRVNVRDGEYFVLGDQLSLSTDSRNTDFGNIYREEVIGRAEYALWPIRCFGSLTGQGVTAASAGQEGEE